MRIELRGIIQSRDIGKTHVDLLVTVDRPDNYVKHHMGVDVKVNRGTILKFLSDFYGLPPGKIEWPEHISTKPGDIERASAF